MSFQTKFKVLIAFAVLATMTLSGIAYSESIQDRIKPIGTTCMAGDSCASATVTSSSSEPRSGEAVYSTKCFACHGTGAAGAPKLGDVAGWGARLAERGLDGLYNSGINGFKGMPPKGACGDCSDTEIKSAIDHILAQSK